MANPWQNDEMPEAGLRQEELDDLSSTWLGLFMTDEPFEDDYIWDPYDFMPVADTATGRPQLGAGLVSGVPESSPGTPTGTATGGSVTGARPGEQSANGVQTAVKDSTDIGLCCPICLCSTAQLRRSGRQLIAPICGHLICDQCVNNIQNRCPTCRVRIQKNQNRKCFL